MGIRRSFVLLVLGAASLLGIVLAHREDPGLRSGTAGARGDAPHHGMSLPFPHPAHEERSSGRTVGMDLCVDSGRIHLLLAEVRGGVETPVLLHRFSTDGGENWSESIRVDEGAPPPFRIHRGMDPQIVAFDERIVAVWGTSGTGFMGSGPMATAVSTDGGKTWRAGPNPADDGTTSGHGFIDAAAGPDGIFHLVWLDDRESRRGLRHAASADGGASWSRNVTVDAETCECCWNEISVGLDGTVRVLYRDRSPRDMMLAESRDGGRTWSRVGVVGGFDWNFEGCPHVGGALAGSGGNIHAVVWTGKEPSIGSYLLSSKNRGVTWSSPRRLLPRGRHADIASREDIIAAVWDEAPADATEGREGIFGSISRDGGRTWSEPRRLSAPDVEASHPRVAVTLEGPRAFWTESTAEGGTVWVGMEMR